MGNVTAALQLDPSRTLSVASYTITGPALYERTGTIDVSHSTKVAATIGAIPAGSGYALAISATASDGVTACTGTAPFSVTAQMTTMLSIMLRCREPARTGGIQIDGTINICPVLDAIGASPAEVTVGNAITLSASAHDSNAGPSPLGYAWTTTAGTLTGATTAAPSLACTAPGAATLALTVTDGDCTDAGSITVTCSPAPVVPTVVRINEVESNLGTPGDWVELYNAGTGPADDRRLDLQGQRRHPRLSDPGGNDHPGRAAYFVLEEAAFGFGLGSADSARLYDATLAVVDSYSWTAHASTTYGRCPNGAGAFVTMTTTTKGAVNDCTTGAGGAGGGAAGAGGTPGAGGSVGGGPAGGAPGGAGGASIPVLAWPGTNNVMTVDATNAFTSNLSGLYYEAGSPTVLWAVLNSPSTIFKLVWNGTLWASDTAGGWGAGKLIHYATGVGAPDSEGITRAEAGSSAIYVATERDNGASGVSRLGILRFDTNAASGELTATNDWNLTADLPAVGANLGLEGITWIPDTFLVANGFIDERTGALYTPAGYANHGTGLFFVGVEANGMIYGYALDHVGGAFQRVATISGGQASVMDLSFDRDVVTCGPTATTPAATARRSCDSPRGHFVVQRFVDRPRRCPTRTTKASPSRPSPSCVAGQKPFFWSDDSNFGSHALRSRHRRVRPDVLRARPRLFSAVG